MERLRTPFEGPAHFTAPAGATIRDIIGPLPDGLEADVMVLADGVPVDDWSTPTRDGELITVFVRPGEGDTGKMIFMAVATIAIAIAAPYAAAFALGYAATGAGVAAAAAASPLAMAGLTAGFTMVGTLLLSALVPPPSPDTSPLRSPNRRAGGVDESPTYSFSPSNAARPFARVMRVYGRYLIYPPIICTPRVENSGQNSVFTALYDFGEGRIRVTDIKIGDTPIEVFEPEIKLHTFSNGDDLELVNKRVATQNFNFLLTPGQPISVQTAPDAIRARVEISFPQGLVRFIDGGVFRSHSVDFRIEYRAAGSGGAWKDVEAWRYKGMVAKNVGSTTFTSEYDYGGDEMEDKGTRWERRIWTYKEPFEQFAIYRGKRLVFESAHQSTGSDTTRRVVNGRVFQRGPARESYTSHADDRWNVTNYELMIEQGSPGDSVRVTDRTAQFKTLDVTFPFPSPGSYEIRVRRTSPIQTSTAFRETTYFTALHSHRGGAVVALTQNHTMMEMALEATNKLSGAVNDVNAIAQSRLRNFDSNGFDGTVPASSNPALIVIDMLTRGEGSLNQAQIDWPSFNRLRILCDKNVTTTFNGTTWKHTQFEWNGVIDRDYSVREAVDAVLSTCRAHLILTTSGKWGVMIDERQSNPRQIITPANSWGFNGARAFPNIPDALRVSFSDEDDDWRQTDLYVYRDGFNQSNAKTFEDLATWGITSAPEAWRYGRYMMAQAIVRSEQFSVFVDVESLVSQRGDLISVQHDVPLHGGLAARVTDVSGTSVTLDRPIDVSGLGSSPGYALRLSLGGTITGPIASQTDPTTIVIDATGAASVTIGDLIAVGEQNSVVHDYIISAIEPADDLSARLVLVKYDEDVYTAAEGLLPDWDPNFGQDYLGTSLRAINASARQTGVVIGAKPTIRVNVDWDVDGATEAYYFSRIYVSPPDGGWELLGESARYATEFFFDIPYDEPNWFEGTTRIRIEPMNALGVAGQRAGIEIDLAEYSEKPSPPRNAFLDVRSQELTIFWDPSFSRDIDFYAVRFTPDVTRPYWERALPLAEVSGSTTEYSVGARSGAYLLRAVSFAGTMSDVVSLITRVEQLPDLNVIATIDESGTFPGSKNGFIAQNINGEDLLTASLQWVQDGTTEAVYNFAETLDLGQIYETRIQNLLVSTAVDPGQLMNFPFVANRDALDPDSTYKRWQTWLEYRTAGASAVIANWGPLTTVVPNLTEASAPWTPWRKLHVGDVTARLLQFRIVATAYFPDIVIVVSEAKVAIDMPDRVWRLNNQPVPTAGLDVTFDPAFREKPVIAITIEGATTAVSYSITNHTRLGFSIDLLNASGSQVSGQIDIAALGFGRERSSVV